MSNQVPLEKYTDIFIDSTNYVNSSDVIREKLRFSFYPLNIFGPGYPTFLAIIRSISLNPYLIILTQILLSALGTVALAQFTWQLTGDRRLALVASLFHAFSISSISLSNLILSDSLFFSLLVIALALFTAGLKKYRISYYLPAAIIFGLLPLIRSIASLFFGPLIIIALSILWVTRSIELKSMWKRMILPMVTISLAWSITGAWVIRDRQPVEPPLAYSSYTGIYKVIALTRANLGEITYDESIDILDSEFKKLIPQYDNKLYWAFMVYTKAEFSRLLIDHPITTISTLLGNAIVNTTSDRSNIFACVPQYAGFFKFTAQALNYVNLNYRVTILSLIGLLILIRRRDYRIALCLVSIYLYFGILSGFTLNQGNRIFLPGLIAWAILISYPLLAIYDKLILWIKGRADNLTIDN